MKGVGLIFEVANFTIALCKKIDKITVFVTYHEVGRGNREKESLIPELY